MRQLRITQSITDRGTLSLDKYLNDVSQEKMITAEDEVALAKRIKQGDQDALDELVRANLRFVVSVAKQYQGQGMQLPDLIAEGNLGLIKAAERYDESRGFKFISYAVWWIRQSIMSSISSNSRTVRIPLNQANAIRKIKYSVRSLEQELERKPSPEEIAQFLEWDVESVKLTQKSSQYGLSLDAPVSEGESETTYGDLMEGEDAGNIDRLMHNQSLSIEISKLLKRLDSNEEQILRRFFGLGCRPESMSELSESMEVSKERIRQIKSRAIKKLGASAGQELKTYLN